MPSMQQVANREEDLALQNSQQDQALIESGGQ